MRQENWGSGWMNGQCVVGWGTKMVGQGNKTMRQDGTGWERLDGTGWDWIRLIDKYIWRIKIKPTFVINWKQNFMDGPN